MSHNIQVRKIHFPFKEDRPAVWNAGAREWSHMLNGASLTMPYLEPFLVKNLREAIEHLQDPDLIEDAQGFIGQEAAHYTNHRRYNDMLKRVGYPELSEVEAGFKRGYDRISKRSLAWRLASASASIRSWIALLSSVAVWAAMRWTRSSQASGTQGRRARVIGSLLCLAPIMAGQG